MVNHGGIALPITTVTRNPRSWIAALGLIVAVGTGCTTTDASTSSSPAPSAAAPDATTQLSGALTLPPLRVSGTTPGQPAYERDQWMTDWADADGDGCSTREEVLIAESRTPAQIDPIGCTIVAGDWLDRFTGSTFDSPADVQIDHLVALGDAHRSGGWAWTAERKAAFANDLDTDELNVLESGENSRKGDDGPDAWMPPSKSARCDYVAAYARVKAHWELTVTPAQASAIERVWATCDTPAPTTSASTPPTTQAPPSTTTATAPEAPSTTVAGPAAPTGDRDCADFTTQAEAQAYFESKGGPTADPDRLDGDDNGRACDRLPLTP